MVAPVPAAQELTGAGHRSRPGAWGQLGPEAVVLDRAIHERAVGRAHRVAEPRGQRREDLDFATGHVAGVEASSDLAGRAPGAEADRICRVDSVVDERYVERDQVAARGRDESDPVIVDGGVGNRQRDLEEVTCARQCRARHDTLLEEHAHGFALAHRAHVGVVEPGTPPEIRPLHCSLRVDDATVAEDGGA
jgi:hypothetical protein